MTNEEYEKFCIRYGKSAIDAVLDKMAKIISDKFPQVSDDYMQGYSDGWKDGWKTALAELIKKMQEVKDEKETET